MKNKIEISSSEVSKRIYSLRGVQVMLDTDLAEIYRVEVRILKRAVRQNIERFPNDFMFELTQEEIENLRSQFRISSLESFSKADPKPILRSRFATSSLEDAFRQHGGTRYMPFAFTEQGVAMLSSVLHSERAIQVNIEIIRTFVQLRKQTKFQAKPQLIAGPDPANIIQTIVAEHFGLSIEDLKSAKRTKAIVLGRQIAIYFMRKHMHISLSEIGWHFGQRDHSTILHSYRKIEAISEEIENLNHRVLGSLTCKAF